MLPIKILCMCEILQRYKILHSARHIKEAQKKTNDSRRRQNLHFIFLTYFDLHLNATSGTFINYVILEKGTDFFLSVLKISIGQRGISNNGLCNRFRKGLEIKLRFVCFFKNKKKSF